MKHLPYLLLAGALVACGGDGDADQVEDVNDWDAYVAGGTDYDVQGGPVTMMEIMGNTHIGGADDEGNTLTIIIEEAPLTTRDYAPMRFTLVIDGSPVYVCEGPTVTLSVLNISPVVDGTFRGPVDCQNFENMVSFSGSVEGRFSDTFGQSTN